MIDRKELRADNYVLGPLLDICRIKNSDIHQGFNSDCQPLPVSKSILLKCGFEETSASDVFKLKLSEDVTLVLNLVGCAYLLQYGDMVNIGANLNYLHKLQNFYYFFTDQELEVSL